MSDEYTYIVSRLNALDAALPDEDWFARFARSAPDSLLSPLKEYFMGFEAVESIEDFESGLQLERAKILDLISSCIDEEDTLIFIRGEYDFDNLLYLWKAEKRKGLKSAAFVEKTLPWGMVPVEILKKALDEGSGAFLPGYLKSLYGYLEGLDDESALNRARYLAESEKWRCLLEKAPEKAAVYYTRCRIDLENIRMFIRIKRTGLHRDPEGQTWIGGGHLDALLLGSLFSAGEDEFYSYLKTSMHSGLLEGGLEKDTPIWQVDYILSGHLLSLISESRLRYFDIGAVLYHIEKRKMIEAVLRSIITGLTNRLPQKAVSETVESIMRV